MTNPTPHGQVPDTLIDLIDAYAETRHRYGGIYNAKTEAARNAVIEALSEVQALSAVPVVDKCTKQQMTTEVLRRMQQQEDGHNKNPFRSLLDRLMRNEGGYSTIEIGQLKYALDGFYGAARAQADSVLEDAGGANWQDISTAPKDGTRFVAIGNNYGLYSETQHVCIAQWFRGCWMEASDWNETSELKYLTHWMPLPSPPDDVAAPAEQQASATEGYVQPVPDKCDRITWRGRYYHLPLIEQAAPKAAPGEMDKEASNARLDTDSNFTAPEQQRDVACSLAMGQQVGNGEHQEASCRGSKDSEQLKIAARNLKYFIEHAQFSSFADKRAALNCLDALAAPQQKPSQDTMYLLRRLLSNQHTLTGPEFRAELEKIVGEAYQQEAQEPCQTCAALARTVMLDQVSFDRKPDCYGIRQITNDEGVEEWEDIRTSPDVAREEANDMMATGRGEIYEVVPLYTAPQPAPAPLSDDVVKDAARYRWLRNKSTVLHGTAWLGSATAYQRDVDFLRRDDALAALDAAIDAALAAQGDTP